MKQVPQALVNFLLTKAPHYIADLFEITPVNGTPMYLTTHAAPVSHMGHVYQPSAPFLKRGNIREEIGLSKSSTLTLTMLADPFTQINGLPFLQQVVNGYLDGAEVMMRRMHMPSLNDTSLGSYIRFHGYVGGITKADYTMVELEVKSNLNKLNKQMPWQVFSPGCRHSNFAGSQYLFGPGCTLLASNYTTAGTVAAGSTTKQINTNLTQPGSPPSPQAAPTLMDDGEHNNNLAARTLYARYTYVTTAGESMPSPEAFISVNIRHTIKVGIPGGVPAGVTGWNVYVGTSTGANVKQNYTPMTTNFTWPEPPEGANAGLVQGVPPPQTASSSYYSAGTVTFTSGQNNGVSRVIEDYQQGGMIIVHPLLPYVPKAGDAFKVTPGCDRQLSTCRAKFNNQINFGGMPYIPLPESVI